LDALSFKENCRKIFLLNSLPEPTEAQADTLFKLTERMLEVNKTMNLTAITEENAIILKHYADSISLCEYIPNGASLLDVGCGAGFPTLPLAIFRPDIKITALDGTAKRIEYVKSTAKLLGLENVNAIAGRAEDLASKPEYREAFDIVTARAVAELPVLSELCIPFVKKNGNFIAMKASQGEKEAEKAENSIKLCGGKIISVAKRALTADGSAFEERLIINISKISQTPQKYPRHYSQISKKPL